MCNFHYVAMSMMTSQILKSVDFTKTQKSTYFENKTFFLQTKKLIINQGLLYCKKWFCSGGNLLEALFPSLNEGTRFLGVVLLPSFTTADTCSQTPRFSQILSNTQ